MEKQLDEVYKKAYTEARDTATSFMAKFRVMDEEKRKLRDNGDIDNSEYQRWRRTMLFQGKRYKEMADTLAADMTKTNVIAASVINGHLPEVYAINHNYGTYEIEHGGKINTQYSLYDRQTVERLIRDNPDLLPRKAAINVPKDELWNKKHINSAVMQGIIQGKTVDDIAKNLAATVTDMSHTSAIRNARTMTTSAQNGGRIDSYKRAQSMGVKLVQVWMATLDSRTRHEHRQLDGQKRPIGTPFKIDGMEIEFPGDPKAEPYLVYNCRCTLIGEVEGVDYNLSDVTERDSKLGDMTYEEWKEEKKKQDNAEPAGINNVPEGKTVENNVSSAKINKKSLDNGESNGIIKSITIDDFNKKEFEDVVSDKSKERIIKTLKDQNVSYLYDDVNTINFPPNEDGKIELLRTNVIYRPGYPKVVFEINEAAFAGKSDTAIDEMFAFQKYSIVNSLEEAVIHESAHAKIVDGLTYEQYEELNQKLSGIFFTEPIEGRKDKKSFKDLAGEISEYAQKDGLECIAECHVKLSRGETIPDELKKLHDQYIK